MKLLNVSVDGLIIKGRLSYYDLDEITSFWEKTDLSRQFYEDHFYSLDSDDIQLFLGLISRPDPLDFKIRVGAAALITGGFESILETLPIQDSFIGSVDIAFDYENLRLSEHLGIQKTIEKYSRKTGEVFRTKGFDKVIEYKSDQVVTGYQIGKRNRLLIRIYDKFLELEAKPSIIKSEHISQYESDNVTRVEFSIVSNFEHKRYPLPDNWNDFDYYLAICRQNILKRVTALTKDGNAILRQFRNVPAINIALNKERVGVKNQTLYRMGLGKLIASLERHGIEESILNQIQEEISESVSSKTDFLGVID